MLKEALAYTKNDPQNDISLPGVLNPAPWSSIDQSGWCAPIPLDTYADTYVQPKPELIHGVMRAEQKLLLSGASKAGKTHLMMELALAFATGGAWLGLQCSQAKVLFLNMELEHSTAIGRLQRICERQGIDQHQLGNLHLWSPRGIQMRPDTLQKRLSDLYQNGGSWNVIIIDPIYKLLAGDENTMSAVSEFCQLTDWICSALKMAVIYTHHHSKGIKGNIRVMDRSSGSGVFARDPDALLDLIELEVPASLREEPGNEHLTAWRLEPVLRDFPEFRPLNLFFRWPIHEVDTEGLLVRSGVARPGRESAARSTRRPSLQDKKESLLEAFNALRKGNEPVELKDMAAHMKLSERCTRQRLKELPDLFWIRRGSVGLKAG